MSPIHSKKSDADGEEEEEDDDGVLVDAPPADVTPIDANPRASEKKNATKSARLEDVALVAPSLEEETTTTTRRASLATRSIAPAPVANASAPPSTADDEDFADAAAKDDARGRGDEGR